MTGAGRPERRAALFGGLALMREAQGHAAALADMLKRATMALEGVLQGPFEPDLNGLSFPVAPVNRHRMEHRSGTPSRLDTDPDLAAFVRARINHLTFKEIEAEVAAHFPPDRRVGKSSLHRWFHRTVRSPGGAASAGAGQHLGEADVRPGEALNARSGSVPGTRRANPCRTRGP